MCFTQHTARRSLKRGWDLAGLRKKYVKMTPGTRGGCVGFGTGLLGSMAGLGGGPFCVPLLAGVLKLDHKQCVGTSLVCALTTLTIGGCTTYVNSTAAISMPPIIILACVAPVFGFASSRLSRHVSNASLKSLFACFLLCTSSIIFYRIFSKKDGDQHNPSGFKKWVKSLVATPEGYVMYYVCLAAVAGTASGLLGIAGGSVLVPLMSLADVDPWQTITTSSLISMIPTSLASATAHHSMGNICTPLIPYLVLGTCVGAFLGPSLLSGVEEDTRKFVCASVLLATAAIMLFR
eukprot:TRINITY_DN3183_c0_g1_i1.p1 TRINITY_DN3183_c0_g1~~TRINITY_DN3183_c0_g1_i1.p1  ORF type:complete len:292 (+),score=22.86 TRINITY_DN3183_c0_g1_i1:42-917(+)